MVENCSVESLLELFQLYATGLESFGLVTSSLQEVEALNHGLLAVVFSAIKHFTLCGKFEY